MLYSIVTVEIKLKRFGHKMMDLLIRIVLGSVKEQNDLHSPNVIEDLVSMEPIGNMLFSGGISVIKDGYDDFQAARFLGNQHNTQIGVRSNEVRSIVEIVTFFMDLHVTVLTVSNASKQVLLLQNRFSKIKLSHSFRT